MFSDRNTLWAGYGERSSKSVYERIKALGNFEIVLCDMINPNFYHLDTCFAPVDETTSLYYPPAFSEETNKEVSGGRILKAEKSEIPDPAPSSRLHRRLGIGSERLRLQRHHRQRDRNLADWSCSENT